MPTVSWSLVTGCVLAYHVTFPVQVSEARQQLGSHGCQHWLRDGLHLHRKPTPYTGN